MKNLLILLCRGLRGMAVKFCTEDGTWDLLALSFPVFFIRDGYKTPFLVHSLGRNPQTNMKVLYYFENSNNSHVKINQIINEFWKGPLKSKYHLIGKSKILVFNFGLLWEVTSFPTSVPSSKLKNFTPSSILKKSPSMNPVCIYNFCNLL